MSPTETNHLPCQLDTTYITNHVQNTTNAKKSTLNMLTRPVATAKVCASQPYKSFKTGTTKTGSLFQYYMTGDDFQVDTGEAVPSTPPSKKKIASISLSHNSDDAGSDEWGESSGGDMGKSGGGLTIVEAIDEKFSINNFVFSSHASPIALSPVKHDKDGMIKVPPTLVLEDYNICYAGEVESLCKYCGNVQDLDLSHNNLQSWNEVLIVLREINYLKCLNVGQNKNLRFPISTTSTSNTEDGGVIEERVEEKENNPKTGETSQQSCEPIMCPGPAYLKENFLWDDFKHESLQTLVLIDTGAPLEMLAQLIPRLPALRELHLSVNGYHGLSEKINQLESTLSSSFPLLPLHQRLKTLYFTDNKLDDWQDFVTLYKMFPNLTQLYIASNDLPHINISLQGVFPNLNLLHVAANKLDCWECLDSLDELSSVKSLRMYNIPFYDAYHPDEEIRRKLTVARLNHVDMLNGSKVTPEERVDAERFFIRHYLDKEVKPNRYQELVNKYGELEKLGEIDLSPIEQLHLHVLCEELGIRQEIEVKPHITVLQLKTQVSQIIGLGLKDFSLFYKDDLMEEAYGPECCFHELKLMTILITTAGVTDHCELHVKIRHDAATMPSSVFIKLA